MEFFEIVTPYYQRLYDRMTNGKLTEERWHRLAAKLHGWVCFEHTGQADERDWTK